MNQGYKQDTVLQAARCSQKADTMDSSKAQIPSEFHIRKGVPGDARFLATLGRKTFSDSFAADNRPEDMAAYLDASFGPGKQSLELADPLSVFLIAEVRGRAAGYARLLKSPVPPGIRIRPERPIQLVRLYACRQWIGRGAGPALMRACIAESRKRRCDGIWLSAWDRNIRAIRFYRKWGFSRVGTRPFLVGNDRQNDLVLWRPLLAAPQ
ncbi:GNAT family N-acetyltransferase [Desulfosarcina alkanivorans]|uniref:GNAT family N-acetyltransferase n=1 Tax=Desulfosarcina alkanivorans TaxID=571177 RepID=UPI0018D7ADCC|nr:GNAT family N-acetyltransferase [Desulfosarcina alkanivorans]